MFFLFAMKSFYQSSAIYIWPLVFDTGRKKKAFGLKKFEVKTVISIILVISFLECFGKQDVKAEYFLIPPAPINYLSSGSIVGMASDEDGPIVFASVVDGSLPAGIFLAENGTLVVTEPTLLRTGTYQFQVLTLDESNNISQNELQLTLLEPGHLNTPSIGKMFPEKNLEEYQTGDVLAEILDKDGPVKEVKLVKGNIPKGTALTQCGKLEVHNASTLLPGSYDLLLLAVDGKGQGAFLAFTISIQSPEKQPVLSSDSVIIDAGR